MTMFNRAKPVTIKTASLLATLTTLAGCATPAVVDVHHKSDRTISSELTLLGPSSQPIVRNPDGTVCYGPQPDASIDVADGVGVSALAYGDESVELPLGGRNPNVLISRDIFFQTCLAESRLDLSREERIKLFYRALDMVEKVNAGSLDGASITTDADSAKQTIPELPGGGKKKKDGSGGSDFSF